MEREVITLTNEQWQSIVHENYYIDSTGIECFFNIIENDHLYTNRHTYTWRMILQRESDGKYFETEYDSSLKDSMGWSECNRQETTELKEVFPEKVEKIIYK